MLLQLLRSKFDGQEVDVTATRLSAGPGLVLTPMFEVVASTLSETSCCKPSF